MTADNKKSLLNIYLQPTFLVCVIVMACAAIGMDALVEKFNKYFIKYPLPLQKNLDEIDEVKLTPYEVVNKQKIKNCY